jgi:protoporphyrin/coproporphyrin ferrochelatase
MKYTNNSEFNHGQIDKIGVLLTNLGTPDEPTPSALRPYLREFLSDPRVVEIPRLIWWCVLNGVILPIRSSRSAKSYEGVWTDEGSPLLVNMEKINAAVNQKMSVNHDFIIDFAMRYGSPSIPEKIDNLIARGATKLLVLPLYPQYSATTTASTFDAVTNHLQQLRLIPEIRFVNNYTDNSKWLDAMAVKIKAHWETFGQPDKFLFSYHGIPQRYWNNGDPYACQCHKTSRLLAERLGLRDQQYMTCFQSRFGKEEWVKPYLDKTLQELAKNGVEHVQVVCPGFSADCLETIEEIGEENREYFLEAGGKKFEYIDCLNDDDSHIEAITDLIAQHTQGWNVGTVETSKQRSTRAAKLKQQGSV